MKLKVLNYEFEILDTKKVEGSVDCSRIYSRPINDDSCEFARRWKGLNDSVFSANSRPETLLSVSELLKEEKYKEFLSEPFYRERNHSSVFRADVNIGGTIYNYVAVLDISPDNIVEFMGIERG